MCGAVVKHLAILTKLCGSFKAQHVTLPFSVTPSPPLSLFHSLSLLLSLYCTCFTRIQIALRVRIVSSKQCN